jgi:TubC N-terminal docking domain
MTPAEVLRELSQHGVILEPHGDKLWYRAPPGTLTPEFKQALAEQKAAIVQLLAAEVPTGSPPVVADERKVIAVKVWSDILGEAVWVVADDLPKEAWPSDAPVYTHPEVKILQEVGPDTRAWVHATKQIFGAEVVASGRRSIRAVSAEKAKEGSSDGSTHQPVAVTCRGRETPRQTDVQRTGAC